MPLDHITPMARGGHDLESNLQPAHPLCNMSKGTLFEGLRSNQLRRAAEGPLTSFVLRIPDDVHEQLVAWARKDGRSLHNLLMWIVRQALETREGKRD